MKSTNPGRLKTAFFAVTAVFFFLALSDLGLRWLLPTPSRPFEWPPPDMTKHGLVADEDPDGGLFWRLRPRYDEPWRLFKLAYTWELAQHLEIDWEQRKHAVAPAYRGVTWEVNAAGFRGPLIPREKPLDTIRLLFLGSSITFGWGVPAQSAFPEQVRQALERHFPGTAFEAINAGIPGYTSYQGLRYLETLLPQYRPDVVVAEFAINDGTGATAKADKDWRPGAGGNVLPFLRNSGWARLILRVLRPAGEKPEVMETRQTRDEAMQGFYRVGMTGELTRVSPEDFRENLKKMEALCRKHGALFFFAVPALFNEYGHEEALDAVNILTPLTISFQHLLTEDSRTRLRDLFLPYDEGHLSPAGHKVVAEGIADFLSPRVAEMLAVIR